MPSADPGSERDEELTELKRVDAVLLQVRQAGIVTLSGRAAGTPVTAGHVFGLDRQNGQKKEAGLEAVTCLNI